MQPKDATAFAYKDSPTTWIAADAGWGAEKVLETYDKDGDDVDSEKVADVQRRGIDVISSEITEE